MSFLVQHTVFLYFYIAWRKHIHQKNCRSQNHVRPFSISALSPFKGLDVAVSPTMFQWPFQEPKLEVPTIYKAYVFGLCKRIYPKNMALHMVLTYLHFRILEFPLPVGVSISPRCHHDSSNIPKGPQRGTAPTNAPQVQTLDESPPEFTECLGFCRRSL